MMNIMAIGITDQKNIGILREGISMDQKGEKKANSLLGIITKGTENKTTIVLMFLCKFHKDTTLRILSFIHYIL